MFKTGLYKIIGSLLRNTTIPSQYYYSRNKWRLREWKKMDYMFIHIPKNAGTSVCSALNRIDPGHFTYTQLSEYGILQNKKLIFCILRDPLKRIVSIYNYSFLATEMIDYNLISWITNFKTLNDFIVNGLNRTIIENNYFLYTQSKYVANSKQHITYLHLDNIANEIKEIEPFIGSEINLPIARKGKIIDNAVSNKSKQIIKELYSDDYMLIEDTTKHIHTNE